MTTQVQCMTMNYQEAIVSTCPLGFIFGAYRQHCLYIGLVENLNDVNFMSIGSFELGQANLDMLFINIGLVKWKKIKRKNYINNIKDELKIM